MFLFIWVFFFKDLFIYNVYSILSDCMLAGQKRAPDLIKVGCEPPCGCWELNSEPLEEQSVLLTPELSLQPSTSSLFVYLDFQDRVSLCSPNCPGTGSADQDNLELRDLCFLPPVCWETSHPANPTHLLTQESQHHLVLTATSEVTAPVSGRASTEIPGILPKSRTRDL